MHGRPTTADRMRNAIAHVLAHAEAVNKQLSAKHGF